MTTRRSSYTKKAALRYVMYYDELIKQIKAQQPKGMFLSCKDFGDVKVSTLHNRFRDALNWLRNYNMDPSGPDKRADYEFLAAVMRVEDEAGGIRVLLLHGPMPSTMVRSTEGIVEQADWKVAVEEWLTKGTEPVKIFENCKVFPENRVWLDKITSACGVSYFLDGDRLTLARS